MKQLILTSMVCPLAPLVYAPSKKSQHKDLKTDFLLRVYSNAASLSTFYPQDGWSNQYDWRGLKPFSRTGNHDEVINAVTAFS